MAVICVEDVGFVGFNAPDLGVMRAIMEDFGASVAREDGNRLFMRGAGTAPFVHVTDQGDPSFAMLGLRAANRADLATLALSEGAVIGELDAPGGGLHVDLRDHDGVMVRVVAEQSRSRRYRCLRRTAGTGTPRSCG